MRFTLCVFFSRKAARVECWLWPRTNVGTLSTCITQTHTSDSNNSRVKVKVSSPHPSLFSLTSHMVLDSWIPSLHVSCSPTWVAAAWLKVTEPGSWPDQAGILFENYWPLDQHFTSLLCINVQQIMQCPPCLHMLASCPVCPVTHLSPFKHLKQLEWFLITRSWNCMTRSFREFQISDEVFIYINYWMSQQITDKFIAFRIF